MVEEADAKAEVVDEINTDKNAADSGNHATSSGASGFFKTADGKTLEIRDVWASNLDEEMEIIRELIEKHSPYVAMVSPRRE